MGYYSAKARGATPNSIPLKVAISELAKAWGKLPWEIKQLPVSELREMQELARIEQMVSELNG